MHSDLILAALAMASLLGPLLLAWLIVRWLDRGSPRASARPPRRR